MARSLVRHAASNFFTAVGNLLAVVSLFSPWFDVFSEGSPDTFLPRRGYGPWSVLQSGLLGTNSVAMVVPFLYVLGMVLASLVLAFAKMERRRSRAAVLILYLACFGLIATVVAALAIPYDLVIFPPFLDATVSYGVYLAGIGFVSVLVAVALLTNRARNAREYAA